jgi:hypothetical protein
VLKAIDTPYRGYLFRSRLEARWAVFFDALGLQWGYEVEGYDLGELRYLPDFKVVGPDGVIWIEVKRKEIEEDAKFSLFSRRISHPDRALLVSGTPLEYLDYWGAPYLQSYLQVPIHTSGFLSGLAQARSAKVETLMQQAAVKAHRARFEHGESPAR